MYIAKTVILSGSYFYMYIAETVILSFSYFYLYSSAETVILSGSYFYLYSAETVIFSGSFFYMYSAETVIFSGSRRGGQIMAKALKGHEIQSILLIINYELYCCLEVSIEVHQKCETLYKTIFFLFCILLKKHLKTTPL